MSTVTAATTTATTTATTATTPAGDWREEVDASERAANVDKLVQLFLSNPRHATLGKDEIERLCREFEDKKIWSRATTKADYEERLKHRMGKVEDKQVATDQADKPTANPAANPAANAAATATANATTTTAANSAAANPAPASKPSTKSLLRLADVGDEQRPKLERAFAESAQAAAASLLASAFKANPAGARALTKSEQEAGFALLPHVVQTRMIPKPQAALLAVGSESASSAFLAVFVSNAKLKASAKPLVLDVGGADAALTASAALASKLALTGASHLAHLDALTLPMLHQVQTIFPNFDSRRLPTSVSECFRGMSPSSLSSPPAIKRILLIALPPAPPELAAEASALHAAGHAAGLTTSSTAASQVDTGALDAVVQRHVRAQAAPLDPARPDAARESLYALGTHLAVRSGRHFEAKQNFAKSIFVDFVAKKLTQASTPRAKQVVSPQSSSSASSSSSSASSKPRVVLRDSDAEDEEAPQAAIAKKSKRREERTVYSDHEISSSSSSEDEATARPITVVRRVRTSLPSDSDASTTATRVFEKHKTREKEEKETEKTEDNSSSNDDSSSEEEEEEDDDDSSSNGSDEEEEEEGEEDQDVEMSEVEEEEEEEDDDEDDDDEGVRTHATSRAAKTDASLATTPKITTAFKAVVVEPTAKPVEKPIKPVEKPAKSKEPAAKEGTKAAAPPLTPSERRVKEAIELAQKHHDKDARTVLSIVSKAGYTNQLDAVRQSLKKTAVEHGASSEEEEEEEGKAPKKQRQGTATTATTTTPAEDDVISRIPNVIGKRRLELTAAIHKSGENSNPLFKKLKLSLDQAPVKLAGLAADATRSKKQDSLRMLTILVKDLSAIVAHQLSTPPPAAAPPPPQPPPPPPPPPRLMTLDHIGETPPVISNRIEEVVEANSNLLVNTMPLLGEMQQQIDATNRQFHKLCESVKLHSIELSNVLEKLHN